MSVISCFLNKVVRIKKSLTHGFCTGNFPYFLEQFFLRTLANFSFRKITLLLNEIEFLRYYGIKLRYSRSVMY